MVDGLHPAGQAVDGGGWSSDPIGLLHAPPLRLNPPTKTPARRTTSPSISSARHAADHRAVPVVSVQKRGTSGIDSIWEVSASLAPAGLVVDVGRHVDGRLCHKSA